MSDTNIAPSSAPVPPAASPPAVPSAAPVDSSAGQPTTIEEWAAKLDAEKAHRQSERNLYRPAMKILGDLDSETQQALLDFAEMLKRNDREGMTSWMTESISLVNDGKSAAEVIAERQAAADEALRPPKTPETPQYLTREEAIAIAREESRTERETAARIESQQAVVKGELAALGYELGTPEASTIINYALAEFKAGRPSDLADAAKWFEEGTLARLSARQQAAATAAAGVLAPPPAGSAPASAPAKELSSRERAIQRLQGTLRG